ncbi:MAG: hypothetical protein Q9227_003272 [Pyrenula ochraceoflavens]
MDATQDIAYISDVGAFGLKPLFITGCVVTTVFLDLSLISERWLRHTGQLSMNTSRAQKILSILGILFAIAGSAGLILLSIFDTYHHDRMHDGFLLLFIAGFILNAVFICAEYQRLGIHYRNHRILRISFWIKLAFLLIEVVLAIVFVATNWTEKYNVAAVFEWVIAFIFTFYILSYIIDLLPSVRTKHHVPQGFVDRAEMAMTDRGGEPLTTDSAGPYQNSNGHRPEKPPQRHKSWRMKFMSRNF